MSTEILAQLQEVIRIGEHNPTIFRLPGDELGTEFELAVASGETVLLIIEDREERSSEEFDARSDLDQLRRLFLMPELNATYLWPFFKDRSYPFLGEFDGPETHLRALGKALAKGGFVIVVATNFERATFWKTLIPASRFMRFIDRVGARNYTIAPRKRAPKPKKLKAAPSMPAISMLAMGEVN